MRLIIATIPPSKPTIEPLEPMSEKFSNNLVTFEKANNSYAEISNNIIRKMFDVVNWFDKESGFSLEKRHRLTQSLDQISSLYSKVISQDYYSAIAVKFSWRLKSIETIGKVGTH